VFEGVAAVCRFWFTFWQLCTQRQQKYASADTNTETDIDNWSFFNHDLNILFYGGGGDSLRYKPAVAKFLVPVWGGKVDSDIYIWVSYRPARLRRLADDPVRPHVPESTISPQSGTKNWASNVLPYPCEYIECISTDQPDEDQWSEHQRSADQRLSTSTKICWSIEQNAI
jgi:hypothetical protein